MRIVQTFILSAIVIGNTTVYAQENGSPDSTQQQSTTLPAGYMTCPQPSAVHKDPKNRTWSDGGNWHSYAPSFADQIISFLGAQWQGVRVGSISCVYKPGGDLMFPIVLHYGSLVYQPSLKATKWVPHRGGYFNCKSKQPADCPFKPRPKPAQGNIYQEAGALKHQSPEQLGF